MLWQAPALQGRYDARVDIWSLGVTAIELVEGRPPLAEVGSIFAVMMSIVNDAPPTLDRDTPASPAYRAFVARALIKEPATRPTAQQLLAEPFVAAQTPAALLRVVAALDGAKATAQPVCGEAGDHEGDTLLLSGGVL
jgi:serine/threonine protein kinase